MLAVTLPCETAIMTNLPSLRCHRCSKPFDLQSPLWCSCSGVSRTLVCPSCLHCFCSAPLPFKRRFWSGAPRHLREHTERFRTFASSQERAGGGLMLVVDDDEVNRSMVAAVLESWGYRVMTAAHGEEALSIWRQHPIEVVVTDALMPKMDGRELSLKIKSSERGASTKVILMTSLFTRLQHRAEAFKTFRVDEFLVKPIKFPELSAALKRVTSMEACA
jgi:CheY-like chemotaxis protein